MSSILVIGGGIAGVSAAARLAEQGPVTLLEAEPHLAHHASGRSAALFEDSYGRPSTVALTRGSRAELEARGVLSPRGLMAVATAGEEAAFEADRDALELAEIGLEEARRRWPILGAAVTRAAATDAALDLDTDRLLQSFLRDARGRGAEVVTGAAASEVERTASGWRVRTLRGTFEAARIVNAAGAWADRVALLADLPPLGLRPLRRSMARVPAPSDPALWPVVMGAGESWYAKPDAGALLVSPAEEDPTEPHDAWADDLVLAEGIARFEAHATVTVGRLLASWAGLRTFAPDRELVIGPDPRDESFLWCAGQGGYGFQTACAASRVLAATAAGREDPLAAALSPRRLRGAPAGP